MANDEPPPQPEDHAPPTDPGQPEAEQEAQPPPPAAPAATKAEGFVTDAITPTPEAGPGSGSTNFPPPLRETSMDYFEGLEQGVRRQIIEDLWSNYRDILKLMLDSANTAVEGYLTAGRKHWMWRITMIAATGALAIINVLAAFGYEAVIPPTNQMLAPVIKSWLALTAAVMAAIIALFSNIESFLNYADQRNGQREARELFLDTFREFESLWHIHVAPFGTRPASCYNATLLYRRLIDRDRELRRKLANLKTTEASGTGAAGGDEHGH